MIDKRVLLVASCLLMVAQAIAADSGTGRGGGSKGIVYTEEDIRLYADKWRRRDGAAGYVISDFFIDAAAENLHGFLEVMAQERAVFESWLEALPDLSFVEFDDCPDLEAKRRRLIDLFESVDQTVEPPHRQLLRRLTNVLRSTEVRTVD